MHDWKHELSREQYETIFTSLTEIASILSVIAERTDAEHSASVSRLADRGHWLIVKALSAGDFDNETVMQIREIILTKMTSLTRQ